MRTLFAAAVALAMPAAAMASPAIEAAMAELKAEPKIVGVHYDPELSNFWMVGVVDDGTQRHGYAAYVCQVLAQHGAVKDGTSVRIVDARKVIDGETYREASLGSVDCNTWSRFDP